EFKVCEKWFFIDHTSIYTEKPETIIQEEIQTEEKQQNELPSSVQIQQPEETKTLEELLEELDTFIGLDNIKSSIRDFIAYIEFQKEREKHGLKKGKEFSINAVFEGNPGTGKTTIARLLGQIFKAMGMLDKGQVVEVDRSGLVGQYVGETAQKTEKVINEAKGGILFIDEAYTLVKKGGTGQDFGQEAIDILLKRMEDMKGEFVVITAGYPDEMKTFLESNPGMKSRFSYNFTFEDYTPDELMEIFKKEVANEEFNLDEKTEKELKKEFITLYRKRDKTFGNARLVKQIFEKLKIELSKRVSKLPEGEKEADTLSTFTLKDIKTILKSRSEKVVNIPIDDEALKEALDELNNLIGLSTVKNEIRDLIKLVQYFVRQNENVRDKFADHILFLGNPGTGKTTVARIVSKIYSALGILPKGHLIEVDRTGLVGTHVGETAQKTTQVIDKSLGGTLFIDEAYTLSKADSGNDFGKESIDTLLKRMEDDRGKFIVIAAGYTEEMQKFISSNPGIKSRFSKSFMFEDYTPDELLKITDNSLDKLDIQMDDKARVALEKHYNEIYRNRDNHFGNARIVRNILERVGQKRLLRLADLPDSEMKKDNINKIILKDL
ncbi:MAG: AAA family ATPase, partial [Melioribacteraceae bacterium]|nr:AAA family ATPase [Melioribacteraceae bacterium]